MSVEMIHGARPSNLGDEGINNLLPFRFVPFVGGRFRPRTEHDPSFDLDSRVPRGQSDSNFRRGYPRANDPGCIPMRDPLMHSSARDRPDNDNQEGADTDAGHEQPTAVVTEPVFHVGERDPMGLRGETCGRVADLGQG